MQLSLSQQLRELWLQKNSPNSIQDLDWKHAFQLKLFSMQIVWFEWEILKPKSGIAVYKSKTLQDTWKNYNYYVSASGWIFCSKAEHFCKRWEKYFPSSFNSCSLLSCPSEGMSKDQTAFPFRHLFLYGPLTLPLYFTNHLSQHEIRILIPFYGT